MRHVSASRMRAPNATAPQHLTYTTSSITRILQVGLTAATATAKPGAAAAAAAAATTTAAAAAAAAAAATTAAAAAAAAAADDKVNSLMTGAGCFVLRSEPQEDHIPLPFLSLSSPFHVKILGSLPGAFSAPHRGKSSAPS